MIKVYEIPKAKLQEVKKLIEMPDQAAEELDVEIEKEQGKGQFEKAKAWHVNEFKKQEILLRDAKSLGLSGDSTFLYIKGTEDFFAKNENLLLKAGAKRLEGEEAEKIKNRIEEQESATSSGIGFIFG
ncbi:MAG: hypothetical protein QXQ82_01385 [Candidatus Pacearchaeota archaeon]